MKLIYRGTTYDYDPTQPKRRDTRFDHLREPLTLRYRGNVYRFTPGQEAETYQPRSSYELIYRGSRYWVHPEGEVAPVVKPTRSIADLASVHRTNLQNNLQRRIAIAREKGDQTLLALLEAEQKQLV